MLLGRGILTLTPHWERENPIVMASRFVAMRLCREEGWQELSEREALWEFDRMDRWAASYLRGFVKEAQLSSFPLSSVRDDELPGIVEKAIRNWMVAVLRKADDANKLPSVTFQLRSLVREIETPSGRLVYSGRQYKLVADVDLDGLPDRNSWEVSSHEDAKRVLASLAAQPGMPSELLAKAEGKLTQDWRKPFSEPDGLILLRRGAAPRQVAANQEPAITPSQMKALIQAQLHGPKPDAWVKIHLVDADTGAAIEGASLSLQLPKADSASSHDTDEGGLVDLTDLHSGTFNLDGVDDDEVWELVAHEVT